jgi:hypothetical protein
VVELSFVEAKCPAADADPVAFELPVGHEGVDAGG